MFIIFNNIILNLHEFEKFTHSKKRTPLNRGRNFVDRDVHYSEISLYMIGVGHETFASIRRSLPIYIVIPTLIISQSW